MLNERDLELIGGVVTKAMEPVREEVKELRKDVTELQVGMKELRADVTKLQVDIEELQTGMEKLSTDVERLGRKTEKIEFIMENELRPNICKIAEGHLDLSRKLDMVRIRAFARGAIRKKQHAEHLHPRPAPPVSLISSNVIMISTSWRNSSWKASTESEKGGLIPWH